MNFQEYLTNHRGWLLGEYLASEQRGTPGFEAWSITEGLSDDQVSALKESLTACMPLNSMMLDLWDWDCHFENELEDDWYFGAAFDNDELLDSYTKDLVEFFMEKVDEFDLDYDQFNSESFEALVTDEARQLIIGWRGAIAKKYTGTQRVVVDGHERKLTTDLLTPRLKTLDHLAYVMECVAQDCIGDGKFEWSNLADKLDTDAAYQFTNCRVIAIQIRLSLDLFHSKERAQAINQLANINRELWKAALPTAL